MKVTLLGTPVYVIWYTLNKLEAKEGTYRTSKKMPCQVLQYLFLSKWSKNHLPCWWEWFCWCPRMRRILFFPSCDSKLQSLWGEIWDSKQFPWGHVLFLVGCPDHDYLSSEHSLEDWYCSPWEEESSHQSFSSCKHFQGEIPFRNKDTWIFICLGFLCSYASLSRKDLLAIGYSPLDSEHQT